MKNLFTSEAVSEGHPDKLSDQISDRLLDNILAFDPDSHRNIIISSTPKPYRKEIDNLLSKFRLALGGWLSGIHFIDSFFSAEYSLTFHHAEFDVAIHRWGD